MATAINLPNISQRIVVNTRSLTTAIQRSAALSKAVKNLRKEAMEATAAVNEMSEKTDGLLKMSRAFTEVSRTAGRTNRTLRASAKVQSIVNEQTERGTRKVTKHTRAQISQQKAQEEVTQSLRKYERILRRLPRGVRTHIEAGGIEKVRARIKEITKPEDKKVNVKIDQKQFRRMLGMLSGTGGAGGLTFLSKIALPAGLFSGITALLPLLGSMAAQLVTISQGALIAFPAVAALGGAFGVLALGLKGFSKSTASAAKEFRDSIQSLKQPFQDFRAGVQDAMMTGVGPAIKNTANVLMPALRKSVLGVAEAWNSLFKNQLRFLSTKGAISDLKIIFANATDGTHAFSKGLRSTLGIMLDLGAAMPVKSLTKGMTDWLERLQKTTARMQADGSLEKMISGGLTEMGRLLTVVGTLGKAIWQLKDIATATGADFIGTMQRIASGLNSLFADVDVQKSISQVFVGVKALVDGLVGNMQPLKDIFIALGPPIQMVGTYLGRVLATALPYLAQIVSTLSPSIGSLTTTLGPFQEVVQSLGPAFVKVAVALNPVINAFTTFIGRTVSALAPVLGDIVTAFASLLPGALKIVVPILNFVASAIERLSGFFTGMSPGLKSFLIAMGGIALVVMKLGGPMLILVRVATFAFNIFSKLVKIFSVVRYVIALMGGPVTIIIAAIMALGAGLVWLYKNNETFRNVVQSVWKKVQEVIAVVVNWFQTTAWPVMQRIFSELGKIAMWLWQNAIKPAWEGMQIAFEVLGRIFSWVWNNVLKPAFMAWTRYMGFLWNYVLKPFFGYLKFEFNVVATLINWWWNIMIKPPLKAFGAILLWLWNNVAKPTWNNMKIGFGILANWLVSKYQKNVKPMIDNFKRGLYVLRDVFTSVRDSIRSRWEKLVGYVSGPLERVRGIINNNFIKPVNSLLKQLGAKQIPYIGVGGGGRTSPSRSQAGGTQKYETGGPVAGSSPSPTADNINAWLTAKEWVIRQKSSINMMRNYPGYLEHINRHGRPPGFATGGPVGDGHGAPAQSMPRYALGGVVDSIKQFAKSPAKYLRDFGDKIAGVASSGTNFVGDIGAKVIRRIAEAVIGRAKKAIEKAASVAGGAVGAPSVKGVMGWQKQWNWLKAAYPSAVLTSSYRPGAITASGNASYHSMGRAIDVTPSMAIFNLIKKAFGSSIKELIYSPAGGAQVKNGRNYYYTGAVRAMHFNHVHWAMANGGMVPSNPYVADMGAMLAPGVNVLHNKLGKPEPLVRADLLDTRLAGLATTIAENTDMLTRINGGSTGASNRVSQPLSGSGMAAVLTEALRQGLSAEALSKLIVEGRFTIDEHGVAYFRGIATDVVQENNDLANHLGRNRR